MLWYANYTYLSDVGLSGIITISWVYYLSYSTVNPELKYC